MVKGALTDEYDVAILMSADTDLLPAAEAVLDGCHQLRRRDFELVADATDYTRPVPGDPSTT